MASFLFEALVPPASIGKLPFNILPFLSVYKALSLSDLYVGNINLPSSTFTICVLLWDTVLSVILNSPSLPYSGCSAVLPDWCVNVAWRFFHKLSNDFADNHCSKEDLFLASINETILEPSYKNNGII